MESPGAPAQRWDRSKWITVFSSHSPTIREVTECLGLGLSPSASTTNRGIPKFDAPEFRNLSNEVQRISKELPKERDALLDFAADPSALEKELDALLETLGPLIWGKDANRSLLLTPDPSKKTYFKDLYYEDPDDRQIIKTHLHRWIVIKACYCIRNRKLKKHPTGEEQEATVDGDARSRAPNPELVVNQYPSHAVRRPTKSPSQSPLSTPLSVSPPADSDPNMSPTEAGAQQVLRPIEKRKSSALESYSDREVSPALSTDSRKRPYHSPTMSMQRKSPRKSLASRPSIDHMRHSPAPDQRIPTPANARTSLTPTADGARSLLNPTDSDSRDEIPKPMTMSSSFPAVNRLPNTTADSAASTPSVMPIAPRGVFPAVNALVETPTHQRTTLPAPGSLAGTPAESISNGRTPGTSNGFTPINAPASQHKQIAPSPHSYASPYNPNEQTKQEHHNARHGPGEPLQRLPKYREQSPQKYPSGVDQQRPEAPYVHERHHNSVPPLPTQSAHGTPYLTERHHSAAATGELPSQSQQAYHSHSIPGGGAVVSLQPKIQPLVGNNLSAAHIVPSNMPTRQHINGAPELRPVNGHTPDQRPLNGHAHAPDIRILGHPSEQRTAARSSGAHEMMLRQCDLLLYLILYFFPRENQRIEERDLLKLLEYIWAVNEPLYRSQLQSLYDVHHHVLTTWIKEREKIHNLQYMMESTPRVQVSELTDRLLALNDLRVMRLKWRAMTINDGAKTLCAEDVLCHAFALMTETEGTETVFKEGLSRLNNNIFDFLETPQMKISLAQAN